MFLYHPVVPNERVTCKIRVLSYIFGSFYPVYKLLTYNDSLLVYEHIHRRTHWLLCQETIENLLFDGHHWARQYLIYVFSHKIVKKPFILSSFSSLFTTKYCTSSLWSPRTSRNTRIIVTLTTSFGWSSSVVSMSTLSSLSRSLLVERAGDERSGERCGERAGERCGERCGERLCLGEDIAIGDLVRGDTIY